MSKSKDTIHPWQREMFLALQSGKLKVLSPTEIEIRRRAAQRKCMRDLYDAWRRAYPHISRCWNGGKKP